MGIIYIATNKINGKKYIGQTRNDLPNRKKTHKYAAFNNGKTVFCKALRKYGFDSFEWGVVLDCPSNWLDTMEKFCIDVINTKRPNGYNSTDGGCGPKGQSMSQEARDKMSRARKGHIVTQETRDKIRAGHLGKKKKNGPACRARMLGHVCTDEQKKKLSEANKKARKEHPENIKRGKDSPVARRVKCIENGMIFDTIVQASEWCNRSQQHIGKVCLGKKKTAGGYHWEYA